MDTVAHLVYTTGNGPVVTVLDGRTGAPVRRVPLPFPLGLSAVDPSRGTLYGSAIRPLRRLVLVAVSAADGRVLATADIGTDVGAILAADLSLPALYAVVSFRDDRFLAKYDGSSMQRLGWWGPTGEINFDMAVDQADHRVYAATSSGLITCAGPTVDASTCRFATIELGGMPVGVAVDDTNHVVYVAVIRTGEPLTQYIIAVDTVTRAVLATLPVPSRQVGGAGISAVPMAMDSSSHTLSMINGDAITLVAGLGYRAEAPPPIPSLPTTGGGWGSQRPATSPAGGKAIRLPVGRGRRRRPAPARDVRYGPGCSSPGR